MTQRGHEPDETLSLLDYRRRVSEMYGRVRADGVDEASWKRWRAERDVLFGTHPRSAVAEDQRASFGGIRYFDHDPSWAIEGRVEPVADEARAGIAHSGEGDTRARRFGVVRFPFDGAEHELSLYWLDQYGGGLFLPFRDATAGHETYGGGRYLLDSAKGADLGGADGTLRLDFNFAYHPSCVWDPRWSCPLAPPENRLDIAVRAGERLR